MAPVSGSTYPGKGWGTNGTPLINFGGMTGRPDTVTPSSISEDDPAARNAATIAMMPFWTPIDICAGGTATIRQYSEQLIPREDREDDDAYNRRIFHAVLPPFLQRLASQAAGTILRKGINLAGGDEAYWDEWRKDVTGDGTPLNEFARRVLVDALLYGHTNVLCDFPGGDGPRTLAEERADRSRRPYFVLVQAKQIRGWRTEGDRNQSELTQVRFMERISVPKGQFGEEIVDQVRVLEPGKWELWREGNGEQRNSGWERTSSGTYSQDRIPMVSVYSNRIGTLTSRPPLLEVANLVIAYCQRFTDYHHCIHVGSQPILVLKGFDPEGANELGMSVNTAVLLPPDGAAEYVVPTSDSYDSQLKCLQTLEEQISTLGISALAKQNITNAAAEAKRLDRIDSDSIMAIISEDLTRAMTELIGMAARYAGKEPPTSVTIPKDYENRLLDGNQITAMLQLQMQGQISQSTLLQILREGEVLPPYVDIDEEILRTRDEMEEKMDMQLEEAEQMADIQAEAKAESTAGGVSSGGAAAGKTKGANTLATPLRPGKHAS